MTEKGQILCEPIKVPTNGHEAADRIIKRLTDSIDEVLQKIATSVDDVRGIGLGVTGPLDIKNGIILECPQLPTLHHFPLKKTVEKYFEQARFHE